MAFAMLTDEPIEIEMLQEKIASQGYGAYVVFSGNVRDTARGKGVLAIAYEAYQPLAKKQLAAVAQEAEARWKGSCAIAHRTGNIPLGECSVAIVVGTPHRAEAFAACGWAIDAVKETVPIWKRETYADGEVWIEGDLSFPVCGEKSL